MSGPPTLLLRAFVTCMCKMNRGTVATLFDEGEGMGWFSKKEQVRRDPQTGLISVKINDIWIEETPEMMVMRDFSKYFRDKNVGFGDATYLAAYCCGFMAGTVLAAGGLTA